MQLNYDYDYDYIIAGGGPCGLSCAWLLAKQGNKCLIVERENTIGGCHRVRRVDGYFCEHGPRIYANAYVNFIDLLNQMNINFYDLFVPYNFSIASISAGNARSFTLHEIASLARVWTWGTFVSKYYARNTTVLDFAQQYNFSEKAIQTLDRLCRLSDGAGVDRYTLYEFLELVNQNALYTIYQPNRPTDQGLFVEWKKALLETENVDFIMNDSIITADDRSSFCITAKNKVIKFNKGCILATPPRALAKININGNLLPIAKWERDNRYDVYVPMVFHYDHKIHLKTEHGSSEGSGWEIAFIVLSDYIKFDHPHSKTVISCCITNTNKISNATGKTANQSSKDEMIQETFRQLRQVYPQLCTPTKTVLSPGVFYNHPEKKWDTIDDAYIRPVDGLQPYIDFKISDTEKIYTVGTHTGNHYYDFTSMEAAVSNSIELCRMLCKKKGNDVINPIKSMTTIDELVFVFTIVCIIWVLKRKYM